MKYDLSGKRTKSAERTLLAFSSTMMQTLEGKRFEDVTVGELCEACNYPRATFYNYFDDIHDLLNYCWIAMLEEIDVTDWLDIDPEERVFVIFDRVYDYLDGWRPRLRAIMRRNAMDGAVVASFGMFVRQQTLRIMMGCPHESMGDIPHELLAEHFSNTLQLVIEWCFLRQGIGSKEDALRCLRTLLGSVR